MRFQSQSRGLPVRHIVFVGACCLLSALNISLANGQNSLSVSLLNPNNSTIDNNALLMPAWSGTAAGGSLFGRAINGVGHQSTPLISHENFQYAAWYRNVGFNEHIVLGRRDLNNLAIGWTSFDTGLQLIHGDADDPENGSQTQPWDNHNAVNMGISGDGRLHLSYDHHGNELNYIDGNATANTWSRQGVFGVNNVDAIRAQVTNTLVPGGPPVGSVTYPRFSTNSMTGDMVITLRLGASGAGDLFIANYDPNSQTWSELREFIRGDDGVLFNDGIGPLSISRNPYLNDITFAADGDLHATFTWRETANGTANHNLNYIRSTDGGMTWLNDADDQVTGVGERVSILSPGIIINSDTDFITPFVVGGSNSGSTPLGLIDRNQTLMNQQGQTVDSNGGVHVLMWSRKDPATHDPEDRPFDTTEAAHSHYFKDPITGEWSKNQIPIVDENNNDVQVGTRGQIAFDLNGNVFAAYTSPGVAGDHNRNFFDPGTLVIAGATAGSGYQDWSILYRDNLGFNRIFEGEPHIDQQRLISDGVLSVFIQQGSNNVGVTTSDLHVFDFDVDFEFLLGDVNQDGTINLLDVEPFVDLLSTGEFQVEADINGDGFVNLLDVGLFVDLLGGS